MMERDRVENNLVAAVFNWLGNRGYEVESQVQDVVRSDLVARGNGRVLHIELRPAVAVLRKPDAAAITARSPAGLDASHHRAVVFREGVLLLPDAKETLEEANIAIWVADPDAGSTRVVWPAALTDLS